MTNFTASACGTVIEIAAGEMFAVSIEENPTTGYRWDFTADPGVEVVSSNYELAPHSGVGGGGTRQFVFRANTPGEFVLHGKLSRSWLGDASAIKHCSITVRAS